MSDSPTFDDPGTPDDGDPAASTPTNPPSAYPPPPPYTPPPSFAPPNYTRPAYPPLAAAPPQYGQPPAAPPQYGQPPAAPPQYGQPPAAPPQYGQPQYGPPAPAPQYGPPQYGAPPVQPQYGQPSYPPQPGYGPGSPYPQAYPQAYPGAAIVGPPRSVKSLATAIRVLLIIDVVFAAAALLGWINEYRLLQSFKSDSGAVSLDSAHSADDFVNAMGGLYTLAFLATMVVTIVWFYRVRANATSYGGHRQRFAQAWSIAGWLVPIANLVIPYQMTIDAQQASDQPDPAGGPSRATKLIRIWWAAFVVCAITWTAAHINANSKNLDTLLTHCAIEVFLWLAVVVCAVLFMGVAARLTAAQTLRNHHLGVR